jgi:RNA polymerase sigma-70 factor (ECF subfamily)
MRWSPGDTIPPGRAIDLMTGDQELSDAMVGYQRGDVTGFECLYVALEEDVRRYFIMTVRDRGVVNDLVQETFLEVHRSRHTYQPPLPVRPWVFGIARHVRWRHRRLAMRRAQHESDVNDFSNVALGEAAGRWPVARTVDLRDVEEAVEQLPLTRREVWRLHHVLGLSFQEIAKRLRIGTGAAKLRSSRAMAALRRTLGIQATRQEHGDE